MRKRTDAIEDHVDRSKNAQGQPKGGVFVIPRKLPLDEWERLAVLAQELLMQNVRNPGEA